MTLWLLFPHVNLSHSHSLSIFFSWLVWSSVEVSEVSRENCSWKNTPKASDRLDSLSFSYNLYTSPSFALARRQTYASELLKTIWASALCQGMCVGFWRRLTSVTFYHVPLFVWKERERQIELSDSLSLHWFPSPVWELWSSYSKWCGFSDVCVSFAASLKIQFCMVNWINRFLFKTKYTFANW